MKKEEVLSIALDAKTKVISKMKVAKAALCLGAGVVLTGSPVTVFAADPDPDPAPAPKTDTDFSFLKGKGNGAFDKMTTAVKNTGASGVQFLRVVGIIVLVVAIIIIGYGFMLKKGSKLDESKEKVVNVVIGAAFVFGALSIAAMCAGFGSSI